MKIYLEDQEAENPSRAYNSPGFKRWQFAVLVIGLTTFLSLALGRHLIWTNFYLLNGKYVRVQSAAWIFTAWCVPLTVFNAFFSYRKRELFHVLVLSMAPLAIRQITLMRNYSLIAMFICAGIVLALTIAIVVFIIRSRKKKSVAFIIEKARNTGAILLSFVFTVTVFLDLCIPSIETRQIKPNMSDTEIKESVYLVSDDDLDLLNSDAWYNLSSKEKSHILLSIATEMSEEMGIETPSLFLEAEALDNDAAYYVESDNSIHIWEQYIEHVSAAEATNVVLHELYHAYQHSLINSSAINWDSPDIQTNAYFKTIWQWKQESDSYIQGDRWDVNYDAYYDQTLESDARDFAEIFTQRFIFKESIGDSL